VSEEPLLILTTNSESQTKDIATALARRSKQGDCILLAGDLGTGKTAFARGFVQALCGKDEDVTSPTFTLMQNYQTQSGQPLWHFDLYRLKNPSELEPLGMDEALLSGITLIEWPEIAKSKLPAEALTVQLVYGGEFTRTITFSGDSAIWASRLAGI
jgi:tRNA threonylcarbamoyl adenosine modification protein YjeE